MKNNENALKSLLASKFATKDHSLSSVIDFVLKLQIEMLPEGSVVENIEYANEGIKGAYKVVEGFDYIGTGYDEERVNALVRYNNKLVLQRQKLRLIASKLGIEYSDKNMKLVPIEQKMKKLKRY